MTITQFKAFLKRNIPQSVIIWITNVHESLYSKVVTIFEVSPRMVNSPPPPNTIPSELIDDFTMGGKVQVIYAYRDTRVVGEQRVAHITANDYKSAFHRLSRKTFFYYGKEVNAFYDCFEKYSFEGKTALIWGLVGCNCDAMSLWNKAEKVYIVDYNKPISDHPKVTVYNHEELEENQPKTDVAISYSSFEHDGFGRYGDPLNPFGDLEAMKQAHHYLKKDGILLYGVPLGQDCALWNDGRIYGKARLPLILKGWQLLDAYDIYPNNTADYPFDLPLGQCSQVLLVLKKIDTDFPSDDYLRGTERNGTERNNT
ncbi:MAG: DUF268 domain-containing protein [Oscillospiraceae bacterium]|jgi:hypothetical protein|nr:DUF268 domain-containing protein [Oscillospiraceae bacterium]